MLTLMIMIHPNHERCTLSAHLFYQGYIKAKNYPSSTTVEVMNEGGESAMFKHLFKSWKDKGQTQGLGTTYSTGKIGNVYDIELIQFVYYYYYY